MKSLLDYEVLVNEVFYKCWHILEYVEKHPNMSELDIEAIKATIMDALVSRKQIDPEREFLNLEELAITNNPNDYKYEKTPNICGIPILIKDELRKKCVHIAGGIPVSMFLTKPPSSLIRYCVYDPNYAFSSIFKDATFYNCYYDSPTREGVRVNEVRPFVEVEINGELYLVDTITKRILKSSWFKEKYNLEVVSSVTISKQTPEQAEIYAEMVKEEYHLGDLLFALEPNTRLNIPDLAEMTYELEQSKKVFPEEWERGRRQQEEMEHFFSKRYPKLLDE